MFENEKDLVTEEVAENTEQTAEETPEKTYTEAEFNAKLDEVLGKKIARREAKIRKEYERKYGDLENVIRAGTGKNSVEEMTNTFKEFYEGKGIKINKKPDYTDQDIETLATADADEFIQGGFEDVVEEAERLKNIGADNMTAREKATFRKLAEYVKNVEQSRELAKIGVTEDEINRPEFKEFQKMFNFDTPISKVYETYKKTQPRKEIRTAGSMKQSQDYKGVKEYYSPEEIERLTEDDLRDPKVWKAVRRSMTGR